MFVRVSSWWEIPVRTKGDKTFQQTSETLTYLFVFNRQMVNARFTRSFLAQIIGLRIHYKYFEQDDPDLYLSKIRYIEDHDVDEMDLYFVEEEYCVSGQLTRTIELIPNGAKVSS